VNESVGVVVEVLGIVILIGGVFVVAMIHGNRNYAFLNPDDAFSRGVDEEWLKKSEGPPPSEQVWRENIIRDEIRSGGTLSLTEAKFEAARQVRAARDAQRERDRES
jgi:hypothetical protein